MANRSGTVFERLWAHVIVGDPAECWEWSRYRRPGGHGQIGRDGKLDGTHRVAWESANGPVPDGMFVLHRCDNPPCCNPTHLFLGDHADNMADMVAKGRGRGVAGTANRNAKLTAEQVAEIRARYRPAPNSHGGGNAAELAEEFGISRPYVYTLVRFEWRKTA